MCSIDDSLSNEQNTSIELFILRLFIFSLNECRRFSKRCNGLIDIYIYIANNHIRLIRNLNTDFVFVIIHNIYYTFCYIKQRNAMLRNTF